MPKQTTDLSKALEQSNKELTSLRDSTLDKQSADGEQNIRINTIWILQRRTNPTVEGIILSSVTLVRMISCDIIVWDIFLLNLSEQ